MKAQSASIPTIPLQDGRDYGLPMRGLILRVRRTGDGGQSASFVLRYTSPIQARRREMGLGPADLSSQAALNTQAESATALAQQAWELVRIGKDPISEREAQRTERQVAKLRAKGLTVRRLLRLWHDANEPNWSDKYARQVAFRIENDAPAWLLDTPLIDLRSSEVVRALAEMNVDRRRKDLFRQRLDWAMEWFIQRDEVAANPAGVRRIVRGRFEPPCETERAA